MEEEWSKSLSKWLARISPVVGVILFTIDEHVAIPSDGMLQLYGVTVAQAGFYECIATNDAGSVIYTCQLIVDEGSRSFLVINCFKSCDLQLSLA